jgi:hypothetical protein
MPFPMNDLFPVYQLHCNAITFTIQCHRVLTFLFRGATSLSGGFIIEASRPHLDTPHSVGFTWMSDNPSGNFNPTTHNIHKKQISMPPVRIEPVVSASGRLRTYALDRVATENGSMYQHRQYNLPQKCNSFK